MFSSFFLINLHAKYFSRMKLSKNQDSQKVVHLERALHNKNPKLFRIMPRFVFNYIKKIVHEDDLNYIINRYEHLWGLDFNNAIIDDYFKINVTLKGSHNLPAKDAGRFLFASNHSLGGLDGMVAIKVIGNHYDEKIRVLINDLLLHLRNFDPLFVGVNSFGSNSKKTLKEIDEAFSSENQILYFPAGFVSRRIKGKITDFDWKKTFITKAIQNKRDIVPIHINGVLSNFFYNLYTFRKFFGIKANLELFYLSDEVFKQKDKNLIMSVGKPIPYQTFDKKYKPVEWAQLVKKHVYKIAQNPDSEFNI